MSARLASGGQARGGPVPGAEHHFDAIGAPWRIDTPRPLGSAVTAAIAARIDRFDRVYSRFREDSLVSHIAREPGEWTFPPDAAPLFDLYRRLYERTDGAMSPLVGARMENLGYDRAYSLRAAAEPVSVPEWDDAFHWDGERLATSRPVLIDVGAAGKGYLVDLVCDILSDEGLTDFVVDASGDLVHRGSEPLRVALEHPRDATKAIGVYSLSNAALCASAANRRVWGRGLHHIIDAVSGLPTSRVVATWAMAPSGLLADGLSTALFFGGAGRLDEVCSFDYVRMFANDSVEYSRQLFGQLFTETAAEVSA